MCWGGQELSEEDRTYLAAHRQLRSIIDGSLPIALHLDFLYTRNHADLQILKNMKTAVEVPPPPLTSHTPHPHHPPPPPPRGEGGASRLSAYCRLCDVSQEQGPFPWLAIGSPRSIASARCKTS